MSTLYDYGSWLWNKVNSGWCWTYDLLRECKPCEQNPTPAGSHKELLDKAVETYLDKNFEYYAGANGQTNSLGKDDWIWIESHGERKVHRFDDNKKEIDCYWIIQNSIDALNKVLSENGKCLPRMGSQAINEFSFHPWNWCKIDLSQAGPGDIIAYDWRIDADNDGKQDGNDGHVALFGQRLKDGSFTQFEAQDYEFQIRFNKPSADDIKHIRGVYRPREECSCEVMKVVTTCIKPWEVNFYYGAPRRCDPLILDLDGDGIKTVGHDAGFVFDYDSNGFMELTGWIGSGDGNSGDSILNCTSCRALAA